MRPGQWRLSGAKSLDERVHAPDIADAVVRHGSHYAHLQDELEQVSPEHAPETADGYIESGERNNDKNANRECRMLTDAHDHTDDAHHRLGDPAENEAVHQQTDVDGAEAAQKSCRLARVATLGELYVSQQSRASPEPGKA